MKTCCFPAPQDEACRLIIHAGVGHQTFEETSRQPSFGQKLQLICALLSKGYEWLTQEECLAIDVVQRIVAVMEDSGLFNAGKGSVHLEQTGMVSLSAGVMDGGLNLQTGAVSDVVTIRNPIDAARTLMDHTDHLLLAGPSAEQWAESVGLPTVHHPSTYYRRHYHHHHYPSNKRNDQSETVGAIVLKDGNLVVATSTGGLSKSRQMLPGRISASAIVGAGFYANNETCAVLFTGHGEESQRHVAAYDIAAQIKYAGKSLQEATCHTLEKMVNSPTWDPSYNGGFVSMNKHGEICIVFYGGSLLHGVAFETGKVHIGV